MPLKSTIEIPIDDSKAQAFFKSFNRYQAALDKSPHVWAAVGKENESVGRGFKAMTSALLAQQDIMRQAAVNQTKIAQGAQKAAGFWTTIRKEASQLHAGTFGAIGLGASGTGLLTGVLGKVVGLVAGLFGVQAVWNTMKGAAFGRRSSQGLGLTYGENLAFSNVYGRLVDTRSFLGAVSEGRGNIASPEAAALYSLGINPASTSDTASTAQQVLQKVRGLTQQTPDSQLGLLLQSRLLGNLNFTTEDLRRIKKASPQELEQFAREYETRRKKFDVDDKALKKMQDFTVTVDAAEKTIQSGLVDKLGKAGEGIDWFAKALSDEHFKGDWKTFTDGLAKAAGAFGVTGGGSGGPNGRGRQSGAAPPRSEWDRQTEELIRQQGWASNSANAERYRRRRAEDYNRQWGSAGQGGSLALPQRAVSPPTIAGQQARVIGDSPQAMQGLLNTVAKLEASPDINGQPQISPKGAIGKFQVTEGTGAQYGYTADDLRDPAKNREAARKILADLVKRYHGDMAEVLAAYNAGPRVGDYLRDHGVLPRGYGETQQYLQRGGFVVKIENATGAQVSVQAAAMGFPQ